MPRSFNVQRSTTCHISRLNLGSGGPSSLLFRRLARGGGVLPYMGNMGMCRCEGYGFQAVYSRIGHINQSVWV